MVNYHELSKIELLYRLDAIRIELKTFLDRWILSDGMKHEIKDFIEFIEGKQEWEGAIETFKWQCMHSKPDENMDLYCELSLGLPCNICEKYGRKELK